MRPLSTTHLLAVASLALALIGCAAQVERRAVRFTPAVGSVDRLIVVQHAADVTLSTGYSRTIEAGSTWKYMGQIPEGDVYKVQDDVFMVEGAHMHEAYSVLAGDRLVGFFLPVEQAFAPLPAAQPIVFIRK